MGDLYITLQILRYEGICCIPTCKDDDCRGKKACVFKIGPRRGDEGAIFRPRGVSPRGVWPMGEWPRGVWPRGGTNFRMCYDTYKKE